MPKAIFGTVKDCIYLEGSAPAGVWLLNMDIITRIWQKSKAAFKSGEAVYFLNGETSDGELSFGQLIGSDEYPVFHTPANTVYKTDDGYANAAAKVGDDYYLTLNEAFDEASDIKELGGVYICGSSSFTMNGGSITGNYCDYRSGGLQFSILQIIKLSLRAAV